jgi:hypothetical protein
MENKGKFNSKTAKAAAKKSRAKRDTGLASPSRKQVRKSC